MGIAREFDVRCGYTLRSETLCCSGGKSKGSRPFLARRGPKATIARFILYCTASYAASVAGGFLPFRAKGWPSNERWMGTIQSTRYTISRSEGGSFIFTIYVCRYGTAWRKGKGDSHPIPQSISRTTDNLASQPGRPVASGEPSREFATPASCDISLEAILSAQ